MPPINYCSTPEFDKDFKRLLKRFRTLKEDFEIMKKAAIETYHLLNIQTQSIVTIQNFCGQNYLSMKVRKMACKSLKGKGVQSGLRVIYVYEPQKEKITFVEIYYKQDQENEDKERLKKLLKNR